MRVSSGYFQNISVCVCACARGQAKISKQWTGVLAKCGECLHSLPTNEVTFSHLQSTFNSVQHARCIRLPKLIRGKQIRLGLGSSTVLYHILRNKRYFSLLLRW